MKTKENTVMENAEIALKYRQLKDQEKSLRKKIKRGLEYILEQARSELAMLNEGAELTEKMTIRTIQSTSVKVGENSVQLEETLRTLHILAKIGGK